MGNGTCLRVTHMACLAKESLSSADEGSIVPQQTTCRDCRKTVAWGEVIRACYGRRAHADNAKR